jgi:predicted NAD-dependent protein-ADP-ribosyltransferase YbiA (DUF1768 family)
VAIESFSGQYRFLSNSWYASVRLDGVAYQSVEHAYQAAKPDGERARIGVMRDLLAQKFAANTPLAVQLDRTGNERLVDGNTRNDTFWGVCNGLGQNWLGRLLMAQRAALRQGGGV